MQMNIAGHRCCEARIQDMPDESYDEDHVQQINL